MKESTRTKKLSNERKMQANAVVPMLKSGVVPLVSSLEGEPNSETVTEALKDSLHQLLLSTAWYKKGYKRHISDCLEYLLYDQDFGVLINDSADMLDDIPKALVEKFRKIEQAVETIDSVKRARKLEAILGKSINNDILDVTRLLPEGERDLYVTFSSYAHFENLRLKYTKIKSDWEKLYFSASPKIGKAERIEILEEDFWEYPEWEKRRIVPDLISTIENIVSPVLNAFAQAYYRHSSTLPILKRCENCSTIFPTLDKDTRARFCSTECQKHADYEKRKILK